MLHSLFVVIMVQNIIMLYAKGRRKVNMGWMSRRFFFQITFRDFNWSQKYIHIWYCQLYLLFSKKHVCSLNNIKIHNFWLDWLKGEKKNCTQSWVSHTKTKILQNHVPKTVGIFLESFVYNFIYFFQHLDTCVFRNMTPFWKM